MDDHDQFCPGSTNECICVSLGRARKDERAVMLAARRYERVGLRAKVGALPHEYFCSQSPCVCFIADVLALLDGSSDGP